jgi:hypothetical protein
MRRISMFVPSRRHAATAWVHALVVLAARRAAAVGIDPADVLVSFGSSEMIPLTADRGEFGRNRPPFMRVTAARCSSLLRAVTVDAREPFIPGLRVLMTDAGLFEVMERILAPSGEIHVLQRRRDVVSTGDPLIQEEIHIGSTRVRVCGPSLAEWLAIPGAHRFTLDEAIERIETFDVLFAKDAAPRDVALNAAVLL